jgi:hypothetical protein
MILDSRRTAITNFAVTSFVNVRAKKSGV